MNFRFTIYDWGEGGFVLAFGKRGIIYDLRF